MKAHYPAHFYAAVLSNEINNTIKVVRYINEMKQMGIGLLPPDVNLSYEGFTPVQGAIRFGLAGVKGIGATAVQAIIKVRDVEGQFSSVFDFAERVDSRIVNKRTFESLIKAGAFDFINSNRAALILSLDKILEHGMHSQKDRLSGQTGLFVGESGSSISFKIEESIPSAPFWTKKESLAYEKDVLGFYASGHPLENYTAAIAKLTKIDASNAKDVGHGSQAVLGGVVIDLSVKTTKKGDAFAMFRLEDQFGNLKIVCWPEQFSRFKSIIQSDEVLLVEGRLEISDEGETTIIAQNIQQLEEAESKAARSVLVKMSAGSITANNVSALEKTLNQHQGAAAIYFEIEAVDGGVTVIKPPQFCRVSITSELVNNIRIIEASWYIDQAC